MTVLGASFWLRSRKFSVACNRSTCGDEPWLTPQGASMRTPGSRNLGMSRVGLSKESVMRNMIRTMSLTAAFVVGLAAPLVATWTTPVQAFASCRLVSGSESWSGAVAGSGTFTVSVTHDTGVSVKGTPPPISSLPMTLTSASGHRLTISASPTGQRQYEGDFSGGIPESCGCSNRGCNYASTGCEYWKGWECDLKGESCTSHACGGSSCHEGVCVTAARFKTAF